MNQTLFLQWSGLIVQFVATVALIWTLIVYRGILLEMQNQRGALDRQVSAVQEQVELARSASLAQNTLSLINYLQSSELQEARRIIIQKLAKADYSVWKKIEDRVRSASEVISSYDVTAIVIRLGIVHREVFLDNWGPSIEVCYEACKPLIEELQKPQNRGSGYWNDFVWLYEEVKKYRRVQIDATQKAS